MTGRTSARQRRGDASRLLVARLNPLVSSSGRAALPGERF